MKASLGNGWPECRRLGREQSMIRASIADEEDLEKALDGYKLDRIDYNNSEGFDVTKPKQKK